MLKLLDLIQVVNEGLGDLLDKQRSVSYSELYLLLGLLVVLGMLRHLFGCQGLRHLPCSLELSLVADEGRRALDSLL